MFVNVSQMYIMYMISLIICISATNTYANPLTGNLLTDLGLATCDKVSVVVSAMSDVPPMCREMDCMRIVYQHLSDSLLPGWVKKRKEIKNTL